MVPLILGLMFGAFIGSFLNVCVHRLPRNESVVTPPSRCYACGTRIRWYDNLPLVGYLVLRGRCRFCGTRFSAHYLAVELAVALLTGAVCWWAFAAPGGVAPLPGHATADELYWIAHWRPSLAPVLTAATTLVLVYYVLVCSLVDQHHEIIPDELTKPMQVLAPLLAVLVPFPLRIEMGVPLHWFSINRLDGPVLQPLAAVAPVSAWVLGTLAALALSVPLARWVYSRFCPAAERWSPIEHRALAIGVFWYIGATLLAYLAWVVLAFTVDARSMAGFALSVHGAQALLGSLAGWTGLYAIGLIGTMVFRRNAMGFGDVKFLAPLGAVVGPGGVLVTFLLASFAATAVGVPAFLLGRSTRIRFGPFLGFGFLGSLVFGPQIVAALFGI